MSDEQLNLDTEQELDEAAQLAAAELENLKVRAEKLGVKFHPTISAEKLREKIKAHQADGKGEVAPKAEDTAENPELKKLRLKREALKLVRVRITCMNPAKKEWEGGARRCARARGARRAGRPGARGVVGGVAAVVDARRGGPAPGHRPPHSFRVYPPPGGGRP